MCHSYIPNLKHHFSLSHSTPLTAQIHKSSLHVPPFYFFSKPKISFKVPRYIANDHALSNKLRNKLFYWMYSLIKIMVQFFTMYVTILIIVKKISLFFSFSGKFDMITFEENRTSLSLFSFVWNLITEKKRKRRKLI